MTTTKHSEELILSTALTTHQNATENKASLSSFGINDALLDEFQQKIVKAQAMPKEEQKRVELNDITAAKNQTLENCYNWGKQLKLRVELAFGKKSPQAAAFTTVKFTEAKKSESQMLVTMQALIALAQTNNLQLTAFGQTEEFVQQGTDLLELLKTNDSLQESSKVTKRSISEERHILFNELYETINKINKVGQMVFASDFAKLELFKVKWRTSKKNTPTVTEQPQ